MAVGEVETKTATEVGIDWIIDELTDDGKAVYETATADGEWAIVTYALLLNEETAEAGTITGEAQLFGTKTVLGMAGKLEAGTVETVDQATEAWALDGRDDGTFDDAIIAKPAVESKTTDELCKLDGTFETATTTGDEKVDGNVTSVGTVM